MTTSGALDAITIDALHLVKTFKEKYSDIDIETMMALSAENENTISQVERLKLREFSDDFAVYMRAVMAIKLPQPKEVADNRSIEERFPEFVAALTYQYQPSPQQSDASDSDDEANSKAKMRRKSTPW